MPWFTTKRESINEAVERCRATPGALLLDVREADEYAQGHIPGSVNLPMSRLSDVDQLAESMEQPLFLYCLSGARSGRAEAMLRQEGYEKAESIGGINRYRGALE